MIPGTTIDRTAIRDFGGFVIVEIAEAHLPTVALRVVVALLVGDVVALTGVGIAP